MIESCTDSDSEDDPLAIARAQRKKPVFTNLDDESDCDSDEMMLPYQQRPRKPTQTNGTATTTSKETVCPNPTKVLKPMVVIRKIIQS
jgi:hypothetical protein